MSLSESSSEKNSSVKLKNKRQLSGCLQSTRKKTEARKREKKKGWQVSCQDLREKLEQVLWQNEQSLWWLELSLSHTHTHTHAHAHAHAHAHTRLCCSAKLPTIWNIPLGLMLRLFIWRDLLNRSTIGYVHFHFWSDLKRADVIQLESVPREAVGLF